MWFMRTKRLLRDDRGCGVSYYHCLSRVIERRFIFDERAREHFRKLMRRQEAFSGVRVLTWTCLSNHFHILVAVEERAGREAQEELRRLMESDEAFLARLRDLYEPEALEAIEELLKQVRTAGNPDQMQEDGDRSQEHAEWREKQIARIKQPYLDRMHDLSSFVGELKQRISQWYNLRSGRRGPLWEDRFQSVLVQGTPGVLATVAAYIDLNAVRVGIVREPKEWRWCGYAEAAAAQSLAREGIYEVLGEGEDASRDGAGWRRVHQRYRALLLCESVQRRDEAGRVVRRGLTPEEIEVARREGFELPKAELLLHRVRYLSEGLALGSAEFLEGIFRRKRRALGVKRKVGPRVPRLEGMGSLCTLKDLRGQVSP